MTHTCMGRRLATGEAVRAHCDDRHRLTSTRVSLITTDVTRVEVSNVDTVEQMKAPTGTFFNFTGCPPLVQRYGETTS